VPNGTAEQIVSQHGARTATIGSSTSSPLLDAAAASQSMPVGKMTRDLYRRLCRRPKSPIDPSSNFGVVILIPVYHLLRLVFFTLRDNAAVRRQRGWRRNGA